MERVHLPAGRLRLSGVVFSSLYGKTKERSRMNLVGKILTGLILVMSLCFMTMALMVYATHRNWKDVVTKEPGSLQGQLARLKSEKDNLVVANKTLQDSFDQIKSDLQGKLALLETDINNKKDEISKLEKDQATLKQSERAALTTLDATQAENKKLRDDYDTMRQKEEQARADRNKHFQEVQRLTDAMHDKANELSTLQERERTLAADFAKATETLRLFKLNPNIDYKDKQPPELDGQVLAVRSTGYVELSIGADQGLLKGHKLEVYSVNSSVPKYLGRIVVTELTPNSAVCKIDPKYQQGTIKNGDRVTTKLER
jgi:myosin heavy subunit